MPSYTSSLDVTIWGEGGTTASTVNDRSTSALGLNTLPMGLYLSSAPTLTNNQVYPLLTNSSGRLLVESKIQVRDSSGVSKDVGFWTSYEQSVPTVIADYTYPTRRAWVDDSGHLVAGGRAPVGFAPTGNPNTMAGVDKDGKKRYIRLTPDGWIQVSVGSTQNKSVQVLHNVAHSAVNSNEWQEVLKYTVPVGYDFSAVTFEGLSEFANEQVRVIDKEEMGFFNCATNTFTDGNLWVAPRFGSEMYVYVTTQIGSASNDVITITYVNDLGVTGRTGTATLTKSSLVGTRIRVTLQTGDFGILDVTNCTHSATGQAGAFNIETVLELFHLWMNSTNTTYQSSAVSLGGILVPPGNDIYLQYYAGTKTNYVRRINLVGTLLPTA